MAEWYVDCEGDVVDLATIRDPDTAEVTESIYRVVQIGDYLRNTLWATRGQVVNDTVLQQAIVAASDLPLPPDYVPAVQPVRSDLRMVTAVEESTWTRTVVFQDPAYTYSTGTDARLPRTSSSDPANALIADQTATSVGVTHDTFAALKVMFIVQANTGHPLRREDQYHMALATAQGEILANTVLPYDPAFATQPVQFQAVLRPGDDDLHVSVWLDNAPTDHPQATVGCYVQVKPLMVRAPSATVATPGA